MTRKLNDADRAAVDMLFDRLSTTSASDGKDTMVTMTSAVPDANIQAVEKILNLLNQLPIAEPPADLATRTLQHVARSTGSVPAMPATFINPDQPLA